MRIERKIFPPQMLRSLVVGEVIEQDRAQNRSLCVYICRKRADRVIGSGQRFFPDVELNPNTTCIALVNATHLLWKTESQLKKVLLERVLTDSLSQCRGIKGEYQWGEEPKNRMRPEGQPPSDRIARGFLTCSCHRGGGAMTRFNPSALASEMPPLLKPIVVRVVRARTRNRCK